MQLTPFLSSLLVEGPSLLQCNIRDRKLCTCCGEIFFLRFKLMPMEAWHMAALVSIECAHSPEFPQYSSRTKKSNNIKCVTVQLCSFFNKKVLLCLWRAYPFNAIRAISPKVMSLYRKCNGFNGFERCFKTQQACATNNPQMQNFSLGFWCWVTSRLGCIGTNKPLPCHKPRFVFLVFCHWSVWFAFASPFVLRLLRFCFPVGCLF